MRIRKNCNQGIHKDIFACLFSIHNTISLSCHEQVCLSVPYKALDSLKILVYHSHTGFRHQQVKKFNFFNKHENVINDAIK